LTINVSNPGSGVASGVVVEATLAEGLTHEAGGELEYVVGDLAPGESRQVALTLAATGPGRMVNLLLVRGEGNLVQERRPEVEVLAPQLQVALNGPKRRYLEREATYVVSIANPGTAAAHDVELATYLPEGLEFVEANNYGEYDPQTRVIRWSLEELPPGQVGEVEMKTIPTRAGQQRLVVEGTAALGVSTSREEVISVQGVAALKFAVADVADPIEVGAETTYEIHVVNQGSAPSTQVRVAITVPDGLEIVDAQGPTQHYVERSQVMFDALPELAPKADTTFRIRVTGVRDGDQRVLVQLVSDELDTPVTKEESTRVLAVE
jgi:uncharacterized membrane protein